MHLGRLIRGDTTAARMAAAISWPDLAAEADRHGVLPLVAAECGRPGTPLAVHAEAARAATRSAMARDMVRERADRELLEALAQSSVPAFLIKGADLAYSLYPRSDLRSRVDTDVLIHPDTRSAARRCLERLRYRLEPQAGGALVTYQEAHVREERGVRLVVDLHWRVANPQRFGHVLGIDEIAAASQARPRLSVNARGLGTVHALLLASVHRVAHHYDAPRLVWAYDVDLLAKRLSVEDWEAWVSLAIERDVPAACQSSLALAQRTLGTDVPHAVLAALERAAPRDTDSYLAPDSRHVARVWTDVRHTVSWKAKAALIGQHLFPPPAYMRTVYAPASRLPLAGLYARRFLLGARRWLRKG
jgi:hypothetical protein